MRPGFMQRVLFICSRNKLRSPTAEAVFSRYDELEVESAGLSPDAENPVTPASLGEADIIFVMEKIHRTRLMQKFKNHLKGKRVICLDIPDDYDFMDEELVRLLQHKVGRYLNLTAIS
jgi:predicted protein tyrosine phosphatase